MAARYNAPVDTVALRLLAELPDDAAAALAVVLSVEGSSYRRPGALRVWTVAGDRAAGAVSGGCLEDDLAERVRRGLTTAGRGELVRYDLRGDGEDIWGLSAGCNGLLEVWLQPIPARAPSAYRSAARWWAQGHAVAVTTLLSGGEQWAIAEGAPSLRFGEPREPLPGERAFIDRRRPPPLLVVFGRGPDAVPVLDLAQRVGFRTRQLGRGDDVAAALAEEVPFATVVMSHHFPSDREALHLFLASGAAYVGALGPRARTARMLPPPWPPALHAPVGLDLGAEGPEEIALAVVAEGLAVLRGAPGGSLRDRSGPICLRGGDGVTTSVGRGPSSDDG